MKGWDAIAGKMNIFMMTRQCIKRFGLFDENIYPAFCEGEAQAQCGRLVTHTVCHTASALAVPSQQAPSQVSRLAEVTWSAVQSKF
jgi:hypothetical protein